ATASVYFQSGDGEGVRTAIPVLDGSLEYLEPFVPSESPTPGR
ncbi:MAG: modification methylase, partial [Microbacterium sp.]|nr:modification methylase [Microbacterium sp.]